MPEPLRCDRIERFTAGRSHSRRVGGLEARIFGRLGGVFLLEKGMPGATAVDKRTRDAPDRVLAVFEGGELMDLGLQGKVAMVAGASKGLGYAVARALAAEGAQVSISSRDETAIVAAARRIEAETGARVAALAVDVRDREAVERWFGHAADTFGGVDALMTNSGGPPAGPAVSFDDRAWQDAADLLLFSTLRMIRLAVPLMEKRGGGAILVSTSSSVKEPIPNLGLSTVLRASVSALSKTLALELAEKKIRVNQIIPGRIDTDRVRQLDEITARKAAISADEAKGRALASIPMGRYGHAEEFGRVGAFLLSDAASYMTGATVQVDGGQIRSIL